MRSFSELLREYTARTGVSDTELARALGVRRQTIFRWKEGLVEKPRSREDVLRCAAKLRLSPEERDEFLLSAGFAPESPSAATPGTQAEPVWESAPQPAIPPQDSAGNGAEAQAKRAPRFASRGIRLGLASLLVTILLAAGWVIRGGSLSGAPGDTIAPAAAGETLIIVGASPEPGGRGISARLKAAIEREAQAGRINQLRVAAWPEEIRDSGAAMTAINRTRAALVVNIGPRQDDRVDAYILAGETGGGATPLVQTKIQPASAEEIQAVALLVLAQVYAARGDFGLATATTLRAQENSAEDPDSQASLAAYLDQLNRHP